MNYYFTSESVGIGHPDKICDRISDSILDECLKIDADSRVAVETLVSEQKVVVAGEITSKAVLNYEEIIRNTIKEIGYTKENIGFDYKNANVEVLIHSQSKDISQGVNEGEGLFSDQGAGDQGIMFGYATNECENYMPMALNLANMIVKKAKEVRENNEIDFLYPDCKSQVTLKYDNFGKILSIDTIVFSTHHKENIFLEEIRNVCIEKIINPVCGKFIDEETKILINPTGKFTIGGPAGDTGVTGRKIIVDSYGGYARHGGGAFSGKDSSKVDRSGAYVSRWIAKNIVAAKLADKCEIQISYAIGYSKPISVFVETFGTNKIDKNIIELAVKNIFDLTPKGIIKSLNLKKPIFKETSFGGHFGQEPHDDSFYWEKINKVQDILDFCNKSIIKG